MRGPWYRPKKRPSMFDEPTLARFRTRLLGLEHDLRALEETSDRATQTVELDQSRQGRLSRMDALQSQAMSLEAKRRRQAELQRIAGALRRIEDGEYGDCLRCGEPIAEKRLELDPAAPLCITCASEAEEAGS